MNTQGHVHLQNGTPTVCISSSYHGNLLSLQPFQHPLCCISIGITNSQIRNTLRPVCRVRDMMYKRLWLMTEAETGASSLEVS